MELLLLADSDILIHFYRGQKIALLPDILPQKICLLDVVIAEISNGGQNSLYERIKKIIGHRIVEQSIEYKPLAYNEWAAIIGRGEMDAGEAACTALARYEGHYVASSNLSDITTYCKNNKIRIYTTMDLLHEAFKKGLMGQPECNTFVTNVIDAGSTLPFPSFDEYLAKGAGKNPWNKFDSI